MVLLFLSFFALNSLQKFMQLHNQIIKVSAISTTNKTKMLSLIFMISVPLILLLSSLLLLKTNKKNKKHVPPTPSKLPLLGHLHLIGSLPHRSFYELSKKHGPVMLLKLGSIPTIVVSSTAAARDLFKLHDLASCSRPLLYGNGRLSYNYLDMSFSPYNDHWREVRKICAFELFNAYAVQSFQLIREQEVGLLLNSISRSSASSVPVDLSKMSYSLTANTITRIAFGKTFRGGELDGENFQEVVRRAVAAMGYFWADFFPRVGWIIDWISGRRGRLDNTFAELDAFFQHVIDDRVSFNGASHNEKNIIDVLLKLETEFDGLKLTRDCIKALIMDIFLAGVDTGAGVIVWAMTEVAKNPRVMKKLQDEIIRNCINEDKVKESELNKLQYLEMVLKEVLRLHPPVPLLLPRETMSRFKLNGYDIDPKVHLYVNVWAIGRDPNYWPNPEEFLPERFIGSHIDYVGQNFEFLPFGAGRRSCPGINMAITLVKLTLANLLLCFDWKLPDGIKEEDLDMEEDDGLTVTKKSPLKLIPIERFRRI